MNLWLRVFAVAIAVIAAALMLKVAPPVVVLGVFVGGIAIAVTYARRSRRSERQAGTAYLGLRREEGDPFGIVGSPLVLLARIPDPTVADLVHGPWRGTTVQVFDLSFDVPPVVGQAVGRRSISCAMAALDTSMPGLVVEPQIFLTMLPVSPPGTSVGSGDATFDGEMNVWCDDAEFAHELLDDSTRAWLRSLDQRWGMEVRDGLAIVYGPKPDRPDLVAILEALRDLIERLPRPVETSHPRSAER